MKESYTNNGNKEIPDNPKLKKNEFYDRQFVDNVLPGEYFDIRENVLECDLNDDDKYAYDPGKENGSANAKDPLNDVKDLTNAVSTPTSSAIVESAGTIATSTATVVVGAAAAVVAFNAVSKAQPKMVVNSIETGSSFVHYNLELSNLELDKDYDIIIRNNKHEFKIDCANGNNDEYVYDLLPGLQYSLTLVSYNELLGEVEHAKTTFYTFNTDEIVGYSNIEIIYNDDLSCGVKYDTTLVDDKNTLTDTYVVVKVDTGAAGGDGNWEIFNSLYKDDFINEEPDQFTYEYANKVHKGTISVIPTEAQKVIVELHHMPANENEYEGELIASTEKEVIRAFSETSSANYIRFTGDYNLVKDIKKINIKKENLVAKISLFNDNNLETTFEKDIDISNGLFDLKTLVKQDTTAYAYQIGYYKADKTFVVIKESPRDTFYGGYYGASFNIVDSYNYGQYVVASYNYDENDNETVNIELLTDFDNYGNDDCFYRVELYEQLTFDDNKEYALIDTYEGTGNPVFKNLRVYNENYSDFPCPYSFKFISLQNYYDDEKGVVTVEMDESYDEFGVQFIKDLWINEGDFRLRGDGSKSISIDMEYEMSNISSVLQVVDADVTLYFFKENYNVITDTVHLSGGKNLIVKDDIYYYLVFKDEIPSDVVGYYIDYDITYRGLYGGNIRRAFTKEKLLMGDIAHKVAASSEISVGHRDDTVSGEIKMVAYMPVGGTVRAKIGDGGNYEIVPNVGNQFIYTFDGLDGGQNVYFDVFDSDGNRRSTNAYSYYLSSTGYDVESGYLDYYTTDEDPNYHVTFTYNNDGTINVYCDTGFTIANANDRNKYRLNCTLQVSDGMGGYVDVGTVTGLTPNNPIAVFKNVEYTGYASLYNFRYDYVYQFNSSYDQRVISKTYEGDSFIMGEDNVSSLHPNGQLVAYVTYDEELGEDVVTLTIPAGMIYDKNQVVTFSAYFDGEDPTEVTVKLSDCLVSSDADGDFYKFNVDSSWIVGGTIDLYMMYNYTLTEDNYNTIKNIYDGNLYHKYTILVTHV